MVSTNKNDGFYQQKCWVQSENNEDWTGQKLGISTLQERHLDEHLVFDLKNSMFVGKTQVERCLHPLFLNMKNYSVCCEN